MGPPHSGVLQFARLKKLRDCLALFSKRIIFAKNNPCNDKLRLITRYYEIKTLCLHNIILVKGNDQFLNFYYRFIVSQQSAINRSMSN